MTNTGALAGAVAGLVTGPLLATLIHSPAVAVPWWAPWRPRPRPAVSGRERAVVTALAVGFGGLAGAGAGWHAPWPAFVLVALLLAPLVVIDVKAHRLPDRLTVPAAVGAVALLGFAALTTGGPWGRAVLCGLAVFAVLLLVALATPRSFGMGDVKLAAVLAVPLGWVSVSAVAVGLFLGFVIGALVAIVLLASGRAGLKSAVPFGPSLAVGAMLTLAALAA